MIRCQEMSLDRKTSLSEGQQEDVGRGDGGMGGWGE